MAKDTEAKNQFKKYLHEIFGDDAKIDDSNRTTDIIYKVGDNQEDWYYFELKTTTRCNVSKNSDSYFGAASLNQWGNSQRFNKHYFFVLAYREREIDKYQFCLVRPDVFLTYISGFYMHVDFRVPFDLMKECVCGNEDLKDHITSMMADSGKSILKENEKPNEKKMKEFKKILKAQKF